MWCWLWKTEQLENVCATFNYFPADKMRKLAMAIAALMAVTSMAYGQSGLGDISQGHELARTVCAECHRVEKGQASRKLSPAKAFQEVANNPARSEMSLRVFLRTPHRNMPNLMLTEAETDNVIAYILSLK
jgi:mono/diheme cytochrome c family protein